MTSYLLNIQCNISAGDPSPVILVIGVIGSELLRLLSQ